MPKYGLSGIASSPTSSPKPAVFATQVSTEEFLLNPDTIVAVSDDDGALHAETPFEFPDREAHGQSAIPPGRFGALYSAGSSIPVAASTSTVAHAPVRFKIRLANTEGRRSSASYLIEKMYGWRGYHTSRPNAAPNRVTLVASDAERALATITVGFDNGNGLLVEELYGAEVSGLRTAGGRLCEFTKLAVDRDQQSRELLAMMFHIAYMYAHRIQGCTDLLIEVNPRHVRFYQRMLGFEPLSEERICARVGAPAQLLWLKLAHARDQIAVFGGRRELAAKARSLYPLFFSEEEEVGIVARLRAIG